MAGGGLTRAQQETELGEGLAVGCLVVGVSAIKVRSDPLEHAFATALASWPWAVRYPAIAAARVPVIEGILRQSARRRRSRIAQWTTWGGAFVPQLRDDDWDLRQACDDLGESTAVAARHWRTLATVFVDGLSEDLVWRSPPADPLVEP